MHNFFDNFRFLFDLCLTIIFSKIACWFHWLILFSFPTCFHCQYSFVCFESREFLLKTDGGYVSQGCGRFFSFAMANPGSSIYFNTHWSAQPVSALARSGEPRKMSQSPVSRNSNIRRRTDRPKALVGVIRGVALTVDFSCLLRAGSGIYGVRYLRAIGYFSMSQCATRPGRERKVCTRRSRMEG